MQQMSQIVYKCRLFAVCSIFACILTLKKLTCFTVNTLNINKINSCLSFFSRPHLRFTPACRRCVANECLSVCGVIQGLELVSFTAFLNIAYLPEGTQRYALSLNSVCIYFVNRLDSERSEESPCLIMEMASIQAGCLESK